MKFPNFRQIKVEVDCNFLSVNMKFISIKIILATSMIFVIVFRTSIIEVAVLAQAARIFEDASTVADIQSALSPALVP